MKKTLTKILVPVILLVIYSATTVLGGRSADIVWPPPPDRARLAWLGEIDCSELSRESGLFTKIGRWIGGRTANDEISLPFDILVKGNSLFAICQNIPALIEINRDKMQFRLINDKNNPLGYPISLCDGGDRLIFITDSENKAVYRYENGKISLFISEGLSRPTGITAIPALRKLFVVDTGEHSLKIFDYEGHLLKTMPHSSDSVGLFNFPTFAASMPNDIILINDALNYSIKKFNAEGELIASFGSEGDGPGTFSRPKGIAVDSDNHIYVVDNLFDNLQIFDQDGQILLALGGGGQGPGQFWSPAGIDIANDTIFIADTYNNRIQILYYLGDTDE